MENIGELTRTLTSNNKLKLKDLRSYPGKAIHVANLLWAWRPFLGALWAARAQATGTAIRKGTNTPHGMVRTHPVLELCGL